MRAFVISLGAAMLTGCAGQLEDVGRAPEMSPVGYGLAVQQPAAYPLSTFGQFNSTFMPRARTGE